MKTRVQISIIVLLFLYWVTPGVNAQVHYVNWIAAGSGDGSSWNNAFTDLQAAIDAASQDDSIWVAEGIYLPTHILGSDTLRGATFYFSKAVNVFGGFEGLSGSEGNFEARDPKLYETIMSGDVGILGDVADNTFHVVYFDKVSDSTRLDGFIIRDGNSLNVGGLDGLGAGVYNNADGGRSHPLLVNCDIRDNHAIESGGGFWNYATNGGKASPRLINCRFLGNAGSGGGGFSNYTDTEGIANPHFINCEFKGNTARTADGGAMNSISHSATAAPVFINCIFSGNHSPNGSAFQSFVTGTGKAAPEFYQCAMSGNTGNAIQVTDIGSQFSTLKIRNSIIYNNGFGTGVSVNGAVADATHSIIPFGFPGEGNIGLDPLFVLAPPIDSAHQEGDLHLQDTSPAINAGKNEEVPAGTATDLDGNTRMVDPLTGLPGTVDIGPYEVQSITTSLDGILSEHDWDICPNPASSKVTIRISKSADDAELKIFDVSGNLKHTLEFPSNEAEKSINLAAFPPGNYFFNLTLGGVQNVKKMVIQQ